MQGGDGENISSRDAEDRMASRFVEASWSGPGGSGFELGELLRHVLAKTRYSPSFRYALKKDDKDCSNKSEEPAG